MFNVIICIAAAAGFVIGDTLGFGPTSPVSVVDAADGGFYVSRGSGWVKENEATAPRLILDEDFAEAYKAQAE